MAKNNNNYNNGNNNNMAQMLQQLMQMMQSGNVEVKPPKKSGVTYSVINKGSYVGMPIINAWNMSKGAGLVTCKVAPYHASTDDKGNILYEYSSEQNGSKRYIKMMAEIYHHRTKTPSTYPVLYSPDTKRVIIEPIKMVISPNGSGKTASGKFAKGYFGSYIKS